MENLESNDWANTGTALASETLAEGAAALENTVLRLMERMVQRCKVWQVVRNHPVFHQYLEQSARKRLRPESSGEYGSDVDLDDLKTEADRVLSQRNNKETVFPYKKRSTIPFSHWLRRVIRHACLEALKNLTSKGGQPVSFSALNGGGEMFADEPNWELINQRIDVQLAIRDHLTGQQQIVASLWSEGRTTAQIADTLGLTSQRINEVKREVIDKLRKRLNPA